ncbi:MAG TPA: BrnT family toxin [Anaerolineales bacterium]|nr:BrnT family toxin [Anaerolineales bacterium]HLO33294.1 BrnT family toxin [Anaerolineales bacterium]
MDYEWDPNKAKSNYKKHGIRFADAIGVFEDENAITIQDEHESEDRFITIGSDFLSRILVVVYTFRDIVIRIISARKATAHERKVYYGQNEE